jgi:hypothetical protein
MSVSAGTSGGSHPVVVEQHSLSQSARKEHSNSVTTEVIRGRGLYWHPSLLLRGWLASDEVKSERSPDLLRRRDPN